MMAEGGGDDEVLSRLRQHSAGLCRVSVAGTGSYTASSGVDGNFLMRLREHVKQQMFDVQNRINAGEISVDEQGCISEEQLEDEVRQLLLNIENAKVAYCNKSLLLQRIQIFHNIRKKIEEGNADSVLLTEIINHSFAVSSLILKEQKETRALEKQLIKIKEKRMALKEKSAELMSEILSIVDELQLQKEPKEKKSKKIFQCVQEAVEETFLLQNVFQRIVNASCVNWAADPKLREAVINAGKDVHSF